MVKKIRGSLDTEIFTTQGGYVRIEQDDHGEESGVTLSAEQLPLVISELQRLLEAREEWDFDSTETEAEPAAEEATPSAH